MSLKNTGSFFIIVLFVVSSASVLAETIVIQTTDTTSEQPGSMFTLTLTGAGLHWSATLDVVTTDSPGWFINYITLHPAAGQRPSVMSFVGPSGNWNSIGSAESDVNLLKYNNFPPHSWIGIYTKAIRDADKKNPASGDIDQGVELLAGVTYSWTWDMWLVEGTTLHEFPGIRVGYFNFDGEKDKIYFTQMSQTLVPEPGTLLLLGSGLLAGGAFFRKRFKQ